MTARIIFFADPHEIDMLKATSKKEMWIPAYTKHDGTTVEGHYAHVNVSDDHDDAKVLSGNGSATQKDAHKLLTKHDWFNSMPDEHKVPVLLKHATELQDAAGIRARAAKFRVAILGGAMPIPSQTKAYLQLDAAKQAKYKAEFEKAGKLDLFNQAIAAAKVAPDEPGEEPQKPAEAAAAPAPEPAKAAYELTPKQYHEQKLKAMAADNGLPLSEVKEMYDDEAGQKADVLEWIGHVKEAFKAGKSLSKQTLDKLEEVAPGAVADFMHDHPDTKLPDGYQTKAAKQIEKENGGKSAPPTASEIKTGAVLKFDSQYMKMNAGTWKVYNQDADYFYMHKVGAKVPNNTNSATIPKAMLFEAVAKGTGQIVSDEPTPEVAPEPTPVQQAAPKSDEAKEKAEKLTAMVADLKGMEFSAMDELSDTFPHHASTFLYGIAQSNDDWIKDGQAAWEGMTPEQKAASLPLLEASIKLDAEYDAKHAETLSDDKLGKVSQKISILNGLKKQWLVSDVVKNTIDDLVADGEFDDLQKLAEKYEASEKLGALHYVKQKLAEAEAGKEEPADAPASGHTVPFDSIKTDAWVPTIKSGAFSGDNPLYFSQDDAGTIAHFGTAHNFGQAPTEIAKQKLAELKAALDAGYKYKHYKTPKLQHAWVFEKDGQVLTKQGMAALMGEKDAPAAAEPAKPEAPAVPASIKDFNNKEVAKVWKKMAESGDSKALIQSTGMLATKMSEKPQLAADEDVGNLLKYGKQLLDHMGVTADAKAEEPKAEGADVPASDDGPKEGDTKVIDGVTYVLKGGRWHKVGGDETASDSVGIPAFVGKTVEYYTKVAAKLKALFDKGDWDGIQTMMDGDGKTWAGTSPNSKLLIQYGKDLLGAHAAQGSAEPVEQPAAEPVDANAMPEPHAELDKEKFAEALESIQKWAKDNDHQALTGYAEQAKESPWPGVPELGKYADTLAAWIKKGKPAAAPEAPASPAPAPAASSDKPESIDGWQKTGGQKGSNEGGEYTDAHGQKWYCKFPASESHAKNELLAAKLYEAAGIAVPNLKLITQDGKIGIASKIIEGVKKDSSALANGAPGVADGFAVDAWLANWDVVGTGYDNMQVAPNGHAVRLDVGGALLYRAQGTPKGADFGDKVGELKTLKDGTNGYAAHAFGKLTDEQIVESAKKVAAVSPETIHKLVMEYGPGSESEKINLAAKLIFRRQDVMKQTGVLTPKPGIASAVEKPAAAPAPAPQPVAAAPSSEPPPVPTFDGNVAHKYQGIAQKLYDAAVQAGSTKGMHKHMKQAGNHLFYVPYPGTDKMAKIATLKGGLAANGEKLLAWFNELEAHFKKGGSKKAAPKIVAAAPTPSKPAGPVTGTVKQVAPKEKAKPKFDPSHLNAPPNFFEFGSQGPTGKWVSSKEAVNESNNKAVNEIYETAKTGDLDKLTKLTFQKTNKETGLPEGAHISYAQHPSQHVSAYYSTLKTEIDLQLNPLEMPEIGLEVESDNLASIGALLPTIPAGKHVAAVEKSKKAGYYIVLGKANLSKVEMPKADDSVIGSSSWKEAAKAAYHASSSAAKSVFGVYITSSGASAYNTALRTGNLTKNVGGVTVEQGIKAFNELLVDIPEGATFTRSMGQKSYGQTPVEGHIAALQQFLLTAEPGTIVQEPGFSSSSWTGGNSVLSNNDIQWQFTAGPGVKMYPAWLTTNAGEGEGLMPPNQRYMIVGAKKVGKTVQVQAVLLPTDTN